MRPNGGRRIRPAQGIVNKALGIFYAVPDVIALGFPSQGVHGLLAGQQVHGVGKLDFPAHPFGGVVNAVKNIRREDVPAGNRQVAGRPLDGGLFHQLPEPQQVGIGGLGGAIDNAIAGHPLLGHTLHGDDAGLLVGKHVAELL